MSTATGTTANAFHSCASLLQELHRLRAAGQGDGDDAEALRAEMDPLWGLLTEEEQDRIRGLSEDLCILAEGGAKHVAMTAEEEARWAEEATAVLSALFAGRDVDAALKFLRRPAPSNRPAYMTPFLQARCWERLGLGEAALTFMREAERLDPRQAVCVLLMLERLGRAEEAARQADRIIANPASSAEELYQAAAALLRPSHGKRAGEARPAFQRVVPILERALRVFLTTPRGRREIPDADRYIITMLGFAHEQLGDLGTAVQLYNDGLARYPGDPSLLAFRGLALIDTDPARALDDCRRAAQAGFPSMWPYYFLAWDAVRQSDYLTAIQLCNTAIHQPGGSDREMAQLYEWLGIALAETGQSLDWVLYNLRQAAKLDPASQRIRHNLSAAEARRGTPRLRPDQAWEINGRASGERALRAAYQQHQPAPDLVVERSDAGLARMLVPAETAR